MTLARFPRHSKGARRFEPRQVGGVVAKGKATMEHDPYNSAGYTDQQQDQNSSADMRTPEDVKIDFISALLSLVIAPGLLIGFIVYVLWRLLRHQP